MLRSYLLVAWRNLLRNKLFSLINISGLAIGMTSVFLIYLYNTVEHSYDRNIPSVERIFRVPIGYYTKDNEPERVSAENHPALGPALKDAFPEIEEYARINPSTHFVPAVVVTGESNGKSFEFNEGRVYYADASLIPMFGMQMVEGDASTSLADPFSMVLTESTAKKYFSNGSAIGKSVRVNNEEYKVTGVVHDLPPNTHFNFELLLSYPERNFGMTIWNWSNFLTYVKVQPNTDLILLQSKIRSLLDERFISEAKDTYRTWSDLQPVTDIHLNSHLALEMKDNGDARTVYFVGLLGVLILVIAWINYINLSTAKAIERAKEVGLRKVAGAGKWQLVSQFLLDSLLINLGATIIAVVLATAVLPSFESLTGVPITAILGQSNTINQFSFWMMPFIVLVAGVLIVGCYPALVLSSFRPAVVLKGKFIKSGSGVLLRKLLVGFQYVLSIVLIGGTIAITSQIDFMQSQDLGYNKEQLLIVKGPNNVDSTLVSRFNTFKNDQQQIPGIIKMGRSTNVPGGVMSFANGVTLFGHDPSETVTSYNMTIDDQFFDTYGIPLLAGRQLTENDRFSFRNYPQISTLIVPRDRTWHPERNKIMINERLSQRLGFKTPEDAIHQKVRFGAWEAFDGEIIGVVKNYHQRSLRDNYESILYFYSDYDQWPNISIRIQTNDIPGTIEKIHQNFAKAFPGNPFDYYFLDDAFNQQYTSEQQFRRVISVLTGLAMVIACLGLVGLGVYTVSQRIKEVGIRKVLGAPVSSILILFCGDSAKIVAWSTLIAIPLLTWGVQTWLSNFAFHVGLEWSMFVVPPLTLLCVSVVTIVAISFRAAIMNPVKSLRAE
ncbi:MAG: ABC transporter permease [Bacteroidota bacterium]